MNFQNLTNFQKGSIFTIMGIILLLYCVGIFKEAFQLVIVLGSISLIVYGCILGDFWTRTKTFINQFKKQ